LIVEVKEQDGTSEIIGRELSIITNVRTGKSTFYNMDDNSKPRN